MWIWDGYKVTVKSLDIYQGRRWRYMSKVAFNGFNIKFEDKKVAI